MADNRIHSTVPIRRPTKAQRIAAALPRLRPQMTGKRNAKTSNWIMRVLGYEPNGTNQVMRHAAKILLEKEEPLISCTKGFFYAATIEELCEYWNSLDARIEGLARDKAAVNKVIDRFEVKPLAQQNMF